MIATLFINTIIEWLQGERTGHRDRLLHITEDDAITYLIDVDAKTTKPYQMAYPRLLELVQAGEARVLSPDEDPSTILSIAGISLAQSRRQVQRNSKPEAQQQRAQREQAYREQTWPFVQQLVYTEGEQIDERMFDAKYRGERVRAVAQQPDAPCRETLDKLLQRFWQGGQTKMAVGTRYHNSGAPGQRKPANGEKRGAKRASFHINGNNAGVNVTDQDREYFRRGIRREYVRRKLTLEETYQQILERNYYQGWRETKDGIWYPLLLPAEKRPTFDQFYDWYRNEGDSAEDVRRREGERNYALKHRALVGNAAALARGPGDIFQLDATPGDHELLDPLNRQKHLGRPTDYNCTDAFSRAIVGFHSCIGAPSWREMRMILRNTFTDKVAYCAQFGIHIDLEQWEMQHLCLSILFDRAPEAIGKNSDALPEFLGIRASNAAAFRADWKAFTERGHLIIQSYTPADTPGRVKKGHERERGERDPRLGATLIPLKYICLKLSVILFYNNHHYLAHYPLDREMIEAGVEPYPAELWRWGIVNRSGHLRQMSSDLIDRNLLPSDTASVTRFGIHYKGLYYLSDYAVEQRWYDKAGRKGRWNVTISYHPNALHTVYLHIPGRNKLEPCSLRPAEQAFGDLTHADLERHQLITADNVRKAEERERQERAILNAEQEAIIEQAKADAEGVMDGLSNRAQLAGVRENRQAAAQQSLDDQPDLHGQDDTPPIPTNPPAAHTPTETPPSSPPPAASAQPDFTDELRRQRELRRKQQQEATNDS